MKYLIALLLMLSFGAPAQSPSIINRYDDGSMRIAFTKERSSCEEGARLAFVKIGDRAFRGCWFVIGQFLYIDPDGEAPVLRFQAARFGMVGT